MTVRQGEANLYVGAMECGGWNGPVVHAAKFPCFMGTQRGVQPRPDHPEYRAAQRGSDLYLNLIDADEPRYFSADLMTGALDWLDAHVTDGLPTLIHCNQGLSRSPSLALLWLAKRASLISDDSCAAAVADYLTINPSYLPSRGIASFLRDQWEQIQ